VMRFCPGSTACQNRTATEDNNRELSAHHYNSFTPQDCCCYTNFGHPRHRCSPPFSVRTKRIHSRHKRMEN